jgi:hypothetical protein
MNKNSQRKILNLVFANNAIPFSMARLLPSTIYPDKRMSAHWIENYL